MIIAVLHQKGGVGKTTLALHVAAGLALQGARVLLVDADLSSAKKGLDHRTGHFA